MAVVAYGELLTEHTPAGVRALVRRRELVRLRRGWYAWPPVSTVDEIAAVQRTADHAVASHLTAAALWGFAEEPDDIHVTVAHGWAVAPAPGLVVHRTRRPIATVVRRGIRITDPVRTVLDLARSSSFVEGVVLVDAALNAGLCSPAQLRNGLSSVRGRDGAPRARGVIEAGRTGAESPMETRLRLVLARRGLPEPVLQHRVATAAGTVRLDLAWPAARVAMEYDGVAWHSGNDAFTRDRRRWRALSERDWRVLPATGQDVARPETLIRQFWAAWSRTIALARIG